MTGKNTGLGEKFAIATFTERQGNTMGQFGILAQSFGMQGAPPAICIIGGVVLPTAAYAS